MFRFIKNWIKPKSFKEVKKESKTNCIVRTEDCKEDEEIIKSKFKISKIEGDIIDLCFGCLRPDQEDCPTLIIYHFKKLLEIANEESIVRTTNYISKVLNESQYKDFTNKVSQFKEYKELKIKQRTNKLQEDFND